jgi:uncharacterized protein (DUF1810 family)
LLALTVAPAAERSDLNVSRVTPPPLDRFVQAQEHSYSQALLELRQGSKRSHWIWYVLPQLRGLGRSAMASEFGLRDREEAQAYIDHPISGPRLVECVTTILTHRGLGARRVLGDVDALKFRSCLTLFAEVAPQHGCFRQALAVFYGGQPDEMTLQLLGQARGRAE